MATGAILFNPSATFASLSSSGPDSILKDNMSLLIPASISAFDLPTPEKIIFFGSAPATKAR